MRASIVSIALIGSFLLASPAKAEYWGDVGNHFAAAIVGTVVGLLDPFVMAIDPPEEFIEIPGGQVTGRFLGFGAGVVLVAQRGLGGAPFDMSPFVFLPNTQVTTAAPRLNVIPGIDYAD